MIRQATLPLLFTLSPTLPKEEAALERQLRRSVARKGPVVVGSATDPYDPAVHGTARALLETFLRREGLEISIVTRSPRIANDLELLVELDKRHSVTVRTVLEAAGLDTAARMHAARALAAEGITTVILCRPATPDGEEGLRSILEEARESGAFDVEVEAGTLDRAGRAAVLATFRRLRLEYGFPLDVPGRG